MRGIANYFSLTKEYSSFREIPFPLGACLFHGVTFEERSTASQDFIAVDSSVLNVYFEEIGSDRLKLHVGELDKVLEIRSKHDLNFVQSFFNGKCVYLDITGLSHSSWAWLTKALIYRDSGDFFVLYSEPEDYRFHESPFDGQIFDLSEKIEGIGPLPSFAKFGQYSNGDFIFMPLLGFEGARLSHLIEDIQPARELTFPIIGVPGFKLEYPFHTYQGNRLVLEREGIWRNRRYERANCPVSIYFLGQSLMEKHSGLDLRIAPIGTKPHALGAILLKLSKPENVDIIYDHPRRKKGRTTGVSKTNCYWLNPFKEEILK